MQLIPAKCPDCGADVKIPEGSTQFTCEYCGGNILVTDLLGSTAVMQNCMMLAYSALESKNYKDAYDHFNRAIEIDLKNPNAWFGKAVCTGMTRKFNENAYGQMLDLFESAFKYSPMEKQPAMKKNAAAEIVKVVKHSQKIVQFASVLLDLESDSKFTPSVKKDVDDIKETVKNTMLKAQEYDPSSNDVSALLEEINSGKYFKSDDDLNENENKNEDSPLKHFQDAQEKLDSIPPINTNPAPFRSPSAAGKKSGCSMVLLILMLVITAAGILYVI
jgi:tetratricopeptide (TPR) repeat protein